MTRRHTLGKFHAPNCHRHGVECLSAGLLSARRSVLIPSSCLYCIRLSFRCQDFFSFFQTSKAASHSSKLANFHKTLKCVGLTSSSRSITQPQLLALSLNGPSFCVHDSCVIILPPYRFAVKSFVFRFSLLSFAFLITEL